MAKECKICGKRPVTGFNVSHSNRRTKRRWLPNLHRARIIINKTPKYVYLCTPCLRARKVLSA